MMRPYLRVSIIAKPVVLRIIVLFARKQRNKNSMDYIREQFHFRDEFHFMLFETVARQALIHCHECLEINFVQRGSGYYIIEQKSYPIQAGDIFIINNAERHM